MSGFLRGYLSNEDWETCASWGNAAGALVVTRHACSPESPSWEELQFFIKHHSKLPARPDEEPQFHRLHIATTQQRQWDGLKILAFDHRIQLEAMARAAKIGDKDRAHKIRQAKQLIFQAFTATTQEYGGEKGEFGLLCDSRYGEDILRQCVNRDWWIARPVEKPQSRPVEFDFSAELSSVIRHFPTAHIVKCLLFHHSQDEDYLRRLQLERLVRLYQICVDTHHQLLLELLPPQEMNMDGMEISRGMAQVYAANIFPDWWKLPAFSSQQEWNAVAQTIKDYDPHCSGVLILGLDKPIARLQEEFTLATRQPHCKGFAIGRSIFGQPCQEWFHRKNDDAATIARIKRNFKTIINCWEGK